MMKGNGCVAFISVLFALFAERATGQALTAVRVDTGSIKGAHYRVVLPANWNKKLVMFAHGYEQIGSASNLNAPNSDAHVAPFLARGYAVARSGYRQQGWALPEGVDDTEALRAYFVKKYGQPDSTFISGESMGGGITVATLEAFPQHYQGGLALCPLASRPYIQTKTALDINAIFNVLFPNTLPSLASVLDGTAPPLSMEIVRQKIQTDTVLASRLARRYELKPSDLPFVILFNDGVMRDMSQKSGGNPYDNTNTIYTGFPNDWELNQKIERVSAKPGADQLLKKYDRTGQLTRPLVMMHTIYDQLITPTQGVVNYDNLVHQMGKEQNLTVFYTNGQAHCAFTPQQTSIAFDALRTWTTTGKKPKAGAIK